MSFLPHQLHIDARPGRAHGRKNAVISRKAS
jgi:hypothetical protein